MNTDNLKPEPKDHDEEFSNEAQEFESFMKGQQQVLETVEPGMRVEGVVLEVGPEFAIVDLGAKSEAFIEVKEFTDADGACSLKVGKPLTAYVVSVAQGEIVLSRALNQRALSPDMLREAFSQKLPVEGTVTEVTKGGLAVKVMGKRAFVPASQVELTYTGDLSVYVGKTLRFKILEIKDNDRTIVLSRAALLREEALERTKQLLAQVKPGDIMSGKVSRLADFGAFVDLGGVEGLIHISELSWSRVQNPQDIVGLGEVVAVKLLEIKRDKTTDFPRISLSLKQAQGDPWERFVIDYSEGGTYEGKVMRLTPFGAFVNLIPGVDGLVHISEMAHGKRISKPEDVVAEGDRVVVRILSINHTTKRVSLSMKDVQGDPWQGVSLRFPKDTVVEVAVDHAAPFGLFVSIEPGLVGLIPNEELVDQRTNNKEQLIGQKLKAVILDVDEDNHRMRLSARRALNFADEQTYKEYLTDQTQTQESAAPRFSLGDLILKKLREDQPPK